MRASGDPYLEHCVETAVMLALVGANSTVVAAGLLHDTLDDSFLSHDYILETFGVEVADLVEGVRYFAVHTFFVIGIDDLELVIEYDCKTNLKFGVKHAIFLVLDSSFCIFRSSLHSCAFLELHI